jgi:hypothetical protein
VAAHHTVLVNRHFAFMDELEARYRQDCEPVELRLVA